MESLLAWLEREQPDILCLQETKVQDVDFPSDPIQQAGYHVALRGQKAHSGVAIISRVAPDSVSYGLEDDEEEDDHRLIRADFAGLSVVNTYVPQGRSVDSEHFRYKLRWFERLLEYFERHFDTGHPLLWTGDFNVAPEEIDVHDPKRLAKHVDFHPDARSALETLRDWGFVDLFRQHHPDKPQQYTYWDFRVSGAIDRGVGWRIDHLWATPPLAAKSTSSWIDTDARRLEKPSDHTFLLAEFDM
jgi:exodeoxyribonuclease-3